MVFTQNDCRRFLKLVCQRHESAIVILRAFGLISVNLVRVQFKKAEGQVKNFKLLKSKLKEEGGLRDVEGLAFTCDTLLLLFARLRILLAWLHARARSGREGGCCSTAGLTKHICLQLLTRRIRGTCQQASSSQSESFRPNLKVHSYSFLTLLRPNHRALFSYCGCSLLECSLSLISGMKHATLQGLYWVHIQSKCLLRPLQLTWRFSSTNIES